MTQQQRIKNLIAAGKKTISDIANAAADIPRPSIRRVLGQGAIKGVFKRVGNGIYTLTTPEGQQRAYIQCAKAEEALPILEASGQKYDMVFLDIPYFSKGLVGGNRGIKDYDFIYPEEFVRMMQCIYRMMRTDDNHVYLMLSKAPSIQMDMHKYIFAALESGFKDVQHGNYFKIFKNGDRVTNVRGKKSQPENIIVFSRSGKVRECEAPLQMEFTVERPSVKNSYPTQKAEEFMSQLILQSTFENETLLDACAGSGVSGKCGLALNRIVHLIEKLQTTIDNFILPKIQAFSI